MSDYFSGVAKRHQALRPAHGRGQCEYAHSKGKIYGLLGPNGAGKTSTIRMITTITQPDQGKILFDGEELEEKHTHRTGYMPEERGLYKKSKVKEQIDYLLMLKGMGVKDAREARNTWLERLGLSDWTDKKTTDLSKGMQQKVQFITTVAHEPDLLILDEPFSGLDPVNAQLIEDIIVELNEKGTTILFSTHRMEQVEELCDHIALFNRGKLVLEDDITAVRKQFQRNEYRVEFEGDPSFLQNLGIPELEIRSHTERTAMLRIPDGSDPKKLMHAIVDAPVEVLKMELHLPRLQEIFIELVGKDAKVAAKSN
ncbi:MAG: ATP-binding cassette domain-containing protein [Bacteroidia bacterium]